jgi:PPK2 family polyphosphate:nucleotide phosphotransferase
MRPTRSPDAVFRPSIASPWSRCVDVCQQLRHRPCQPKTTQARAIVAELRGARRGRSRVLVQAFSVGVTDRGESGRIGVLECDPVGPDDDKRRGDGVNKKEMKRMVKMARKLAKPFRVTDDGFRLKDIDPGDTLDFTSEDKPRAKEALATGIDVLAELQDMLYAQDRWAVLLIFQAMDAAGKDGAIKHVMSGVNPQGCQVYSFKAPSSEDLDHDYLWRCMKCLPERGRIGIFNRSYYEETLVVRVHPELLAAQRLPADLVTKDIWDERFQDIRAFERYLTRNGVIVRKFFLHVSNKEQRKRFLSRIEEPEKNWKFSAGDAREREYWDEYMDAYEDMIRNTATKRAPWYVVPADNKWFTRVVVAAAVIEALASLDLSYPTISDAKRKDLAAARRQLLGGK